MILFIIVALTVCSIALRFAVLNLEVAMYAASRVNKIQNSANNALVKSKKINKNVKTVSKIVTTTSNVAMKAAKVVKPVAKQALLATLKLTRFLVSRVRDVFVALGGVMLALDIAIFVIIVASSASFITLYCDVGEDGGIEFNQDVLDSLVKTSSSSTTDSSVATGSNLTDEQVQDLILKECKKITDYVRQHGFTYGDAPKNPAINHDAKKVSCDRFVCWVLYNLGWTDQPETSGLVVRSTDKTHDFTTYCENHGFTKITDKSQLKPGDIMFVGHPVRHMYINGTWHEDVKMWDRYDCGSDARITGNRPSPSIEKIESDWAYAYRVDYTKLGKSSGSSNSSSSSSGKFLLQCSNPDSSYTGTKWTVEDRDALEALVYGEYGTSYEGCVLVAQTIRDNMVTSNCHNAKTIKKQYGYTAPINKGTNENAKKAVAYVFDEGGSAVQHKLMCFYASNITTSKWHERQTFVYQLNYVRFFDY